MHRTLCLLCLTLLTNALAAQEIDSRDHLDGTQWFIDAFRVMDGHPPEYAIQNALELELLFDRGGELRILRQGKVMATENLRIDSSGQSQSLTLDLDCGALGILHFDIEISEGELTGSLSAAKDEKGLPEYELTGRKATSLDGTRWKLTLTPEATEVDEAVDGPFSQLLRFHRGRIQLVHDEDSELSLDPVFYSSSKLDGNLAVSSLADEEMEEGPAWRLLVTEKEIRGNLIEASDGEILNKYRIHGTRLPGRSPLQNAK